MRPATLLAVGLALAVGAGVGWWFRRSAGAGRADDARLESLEDEARDLRRERDAAETAAAAAERGAPPPAEPPAEPPPGPRPLPTPDGPPPSIVTPADLATPEEPPPGPPKYLIAGYEEALKAVDWTSVGKSMSAMAPVAAAFAERVLETGKRPSDLIGKLGDLNGPLVTAALKAREKTGVSNVNGAFTHPAFMVNAIAATLEAAGKPLRDDQSAPLEKAAVLYTERDRARAAGYDSNTFAQAKFLDEAALRDDFFAAAHGLLTPEQRQVLWPAASRGRTGLDIFSSALLWSTIARALPFKDREGLVGDLTEVVVKSFELPEDRRPVARDAVVAFVDGIPASVLETPADALSKMNLLPVAYVTDTAKRWLTLEQRLLAQGRLDDPAAAKIRGTPFVLVPIRVE